MDYDLPSALWIMLLVLVTLFVFRLTAGFLVSRENGPAQTVGKAIGSIVG